MELGLREPLDGEITVAHARSIFSPTASHFFTLNFFFTDPPLFFHISVNTALTKP